MDWLALQAELAEWRKAQIPLDFWWRDDDAVAATPALDRLAGLAEEFDVACHIAVIPKHAEDSLVRRCEADPMLVPLVHGWAHQNNAPPTEKKSEFGHPRPELIEDTAKGIQRMQALFGPHMLSMFVPPWNRITPDLAAALPDLGYEALSTFTPRAAREAAPGLVQINTHVDPIYWRGGGGLLPPDTLMPHIISTLQARRADPGLRAEPLGLLTHHLVHDEAIWRFTERFLGTLLDAGARPMNLLNQRECLP